MAMKVDESTISVTFFLNKRMKPKSYSGEKWYPIYARIHFKGNNTKVKVFDRRGNDIFSTEEKFEEFNKLFHSSGAERAFINYGGGSALDLLDCEEIYIKSIEYEWGKMKSDFTFSDFTSHLKVWQQGLRHVLMQCLIDKAIQLSKLHLDFNEFRNINIEKVFSDDTAFENWIGLIKNNESLNSISDIAECTIAYTQFIEEKMQSLSNYTGIGRNATYRGTVISWIDGADKIDFNQYLKGNSESVFKDIAPHVSKFFCYKFRNFFKVKSKRVDDYEKVINNCIETLK